VYSVHVTNNISFELTYVAFLSHEDRFWGVVNHLVSPLLLCQCVATHLSDARQPFCARCFISTHKLSLTVCCLQDMKGSRELGVFGAVMARSIQVRTQRVVSYAAVGDFNPFAHKSDINMKISMINTDNHLFSGAFHRDLLTNLAVQDLR
jgi:hypothetical protein